jgi:hypothetical protein
MRAAVPLPILAFSILAPLAHAAEPATVAATTSPPEPAAASSSSSSSSFAAARPSAALGAIAGSVVGAGAGIVVASAVPGIRDTRQVAPLSVTMTAATLLGGTIGAGLGGVAGGGGGAAAAAAAATGALPGGLVGAAVGAMASFVTLSAVPTLATAPSVDEQLHPAVAVVQSLLWVGTAAGAVGGAVVGLSIADGCSASE